MVDKKIKFNFYKIYFNFNTKNFYISTVCYKFIYNFIETKVETTKGYKSEAMIIREKELEEEKLEKMRILFYNFKIFIFIWFIKPPFFNSKKKLNIKKIYSISDINCIKNIFKFN